MLAELLVAANLAAQQAASDAVLDTRAIAEADAHLKTHRDEAGIPPGEPLPKALRIVKDPEWRGAGRVMTVVYPRQAMNGLPVIWTDLTITLHQFDDGSVSIADDGLRGGWEPKAPKSLVPTLTEAQALSKLRGMRIVSVLGAGEGAGSRLQDADLPASARLVVLPGYVRGLGAVGSDAAVGWAIRLDQYQVRSPKDGTVWTGMTAYVDGVTGEPLFAESGRGTYWRFD